MCFICCCITVYQQEVAAYFRLSYPHPYQPELDQLSVDVCPVDKVAPQEPGELDSTPCDFINSVSDLASMCQKLKTCTEIAIDLEV